MNRLVLSFLLTLFVTIRTGATDINIIPYPQSIEIKRGICDLSQGFNLKGEKQNQSYIKEVLISDFDLSPSTRGVAIDLRINLNAGENPEAYRLTITSKKITIESPSQNGIFYGFQTLRQLIRDLKTPCLVINDRPAFEWRSYMLDEARYFQGKETVKKLLDEMALLKFNKFHWHLTNDAGWRIEIKRYPLLTEIGSVRDSSQINDNGKKWSSQIFDGKVHKGFYTQEDIKELIEYARKRYITIIPEISMPGHASAAVAAYPWLGTLNERIKVPEKFGVVQTVFNPADPKVIQFLHNVLKEVSGLFPADVIHIGGDEVKYDQWETSPLITNYMTENNLTTYSDIQVKFTNDISNFIADSLGKRMMGWNEILGTNIHDWATTEDAKTKLSPEAIIHFWKGTSKNLEQAIINGYDLVNSNHEYTYLDYTYELIDLQKAYSFKPAPDVFTIEQKNQILGLRCQMWGEWTPTHKEVEYQTYPRIAAYSEVGWTDNDRKNYERFEKGLEFFITRWNKKGYHIAPLSMSKLKEEIVDYE